MSRSPETVGQSETTSAHTPSSHGIDVGPRADTEPPSTRPWRIWLGMLVVVSAVAASIAAVQGGTEAAEAGISDIPHMDNGKIVFSEAFGRRVGLSGVEVRSAPLTPVVSAVGTVGFNPRHVASVGTRLRGVVRELNVYEGAQVKKRQALAEINSPELGEAQAQVLMLRAQARSAESRAAREAKLAEKNLSTVMEAEQAATQHNTYRSMLQAAEQKVQALAGGPSAPLKSLGVHTLTSPIEGTVVERHITRGQLVEGDNVAFLIAKLDHLWVQLDVFERNLASIRVGNEVRLRAISGSGDVIRGRVAQVSAVIDPDTRSAPVRIEVDNTQHQLRVGQAVDAQIMASQAAHAMATVVPKAAVTYIDGQATVFVQTAPLSVVPTTVQLGDANDQEYQILKGLESGQKVVVQGVFELKSELFR